MNTLKISIIFVLSVIIAVPIAASSKDADECRVSTDFAAKKKPKKTKNQSATSASNAASSSVSSKGPQAASEPADEPKRSQKKQEFDILYHFNQVTTASEHARDGATSLLEDFIKKELTPEQYKTLIAFQDEDGYTLAFHAMFNDDFYLLKFIKNDSNLQHISKEPATLLMEAIFTDDLEKVKRTWKIIKDKVDINQKVYTGTAQNIYKFSTALHDAIKSHNPEMVGFIIDECRANILIDDFEEFNRSFLEDFHEKDSEDRQATHEISIILHNRIDQARKELEPQILRGNVEIVVLFNDLRIRMKNREANIKNILDQIKQIKPDNYKELIEFKDRHGNTLLMLAALYSNIQVAQHILNSSESTINHCNVWGDNALAFAVDQRVPGEIKKDIDSVKIMVQLLLNHGANPDQKIGINRDYTPLSDALLWLNPSLIEIFLQKMNLALSNLNYVAIFERKYKSLPPVRQNNKLKASIIKILKDTKEKQAIELTLKSPHATTVTQPQDLDKRREEIVKKTMTALAKTREDRIAQELAAKQAEQKQAQQLAQEQAYRQELEKLNQELQLPSQDYSGVTTSKLLAELKNKRGQKEARDAALKMEALRAQQQASEIAARKKTIIDILIDKDLELGLPKIDYTNFSLEQLQAKLVDQDKLSKDPQSKSEQERNISPSSMSSSPSPDSSDEGSNRKKVKKVSKLNKAKYKASCTVQAQQKSHKKDTQDLKTKHAFASPSISSSAAPVRLAVAAKPGQKQAEEDAVKRDMDIHQLVQSVKRQKPLIKNVAGQAIVCSLLTRLSKDWQAHQAFLDKDQPVVDSDFASYGLPLEIQSAIDLPQFDIAEEPITANNSFPW
jgi:ankyrin repeat protein